MGLVVRIRLQEAQEGSRETEKAAIFNHFEQVLPEEEKALFTAERDRIKKEIDDYFDKKMPGEKYKKGIVEENFKEVNRWTYLQRMEQVVKKNKKWKELYESNVLSSHLEKVDMQTLHGGMSADATTAITGNLTETSILAGTLRDKNQLNLFMDDMLANYMEKHYNEWSKTRERPDDGSLRETEDLAKGFLHAILEQREPKHKSQEKGFFTGIITREEIGDVLSEAIADTGEAYLQSEGFKEANELFDNWLKKENKQAVFARLEAKYGRDALYETMRDMAVGMLRYAADHKEENTNMDYERFSGRYSVPARKEFEKIKKALTERRSVVAGTARLEKADGSREGTSGEPLFDGIASLHAYMVVGTRTEQRDGKEILYVRVRNPWSGYGVRYVENEDGSVSAEQDASDITKGESEMELNDFFTRVRRVTYGKVA